MDEDCEYITITNKIHTPVYRMTNNQKELRQMKKQYADECQDKWEEFC